MQKYGSKMGVKVEQLPLGTVYAEGILLLTFRSYQHGEQQKGNTLHHVQPPIFLMRQINKRSHFTDLTSHVSPMLRSQGSSPSWAPFDLSTRHVL